MILISQLDFKYPSEGFRLRIPDLKIEGSKSTAFIGPSWCGKTTLLYLLSGICKPRTGLIKLGETELTALDEGAVRRQRNSAMGFVFQEFELLEYLTIRENILLSEILNSNGSSDKIETRLIQLAESVGVSALLNRYPRTLSQGEKQRTAICRAVVHHPAYVFADEPTGNLDPKNTDLIMDLLLQHTRQIGATLVMVTHDHNLLPRFDQVIDFAEFIGSA